MKSLFILIFVFYFSIPSICFAQKFGYVDTEYVVSKLPDYNKAQSEIDAQSTKWEKEISGMWAEIDKIQESYRTEEILLTDQLKAERRKIIDDKKKAVTEYQKKVFGYQGLLYLKKQDIMKPLQDKIFNAIQKVCRAKKLDFLFDKTSDCLVMLYTNPTHDYTDYLMESLGIKDSEQKPNK